MKKARKRLLPWPLIVRLKKEGDEAAAKEAYTTLQENVPYFGYGYIKDVNQLVPNVPLNFYAFRVMVILGGYFILVFHPGAFLCL